MREKELKKLLQTRKRRNSRKDSTVIRIKTPEQIEGIRKSCRLAAQTLEHIRDFIVPGVSTLEINNKAERFIVENGAIPAPLNYRGFPKATCTSINEVICHGVPSASVVLKEGDILNVDVTTILDGYYGDTSRMFRVGTIGNEAKILLEVARNCLTIGIGQVYPGNRFGNIGYAIQEYVRKFGFSIVTAFCGHGVGVEFHEEPQINHTAPKNSGPVMAPGMIFTIEPMINAGVPGAIVDEQDHWTARTEDGLLSAQYEHTVLVVEDGCEILTQSNW
jgi:methionyl aminopeptidase